MTAIQKRTAQITEHLKQEYPDATCSLDYTDAMQLLISTRLAAQCTDLRVNLVTPTLFKKYPNAAALANADVADVEKIIKSCGLYKTKARNIVATGKMLVERFNSIVPDTMDELLQLPGIGRKTANLVLGDVFGKPAIVCDTHCIRITNLLGLTTGKDPYKCELQLRELLDPAESNNFCHRIVLHGRAVCVARRPQCVKCCLNEFCDFATCKKG